MIDAITDVIGLNSAFGTGFIEEIDWEKKRVTIKMDNGTKQFVNPQEVESASTMGPAKQVSKTVTTTETAGGVTRVVKSVTSTTTTTTTSRTEN